MGFPTELIRFSDISGHSVDLFYVLLLYNGRYDFLPDLYDVFGRDLTMKIMDLFAGLTIKFPSVKEIKKLALEVDVYTRLSSAGTSGRQSDVVGNLIDEYGIGEQTVWSIFNKVKGVLEGDLKMFILNRGLKGG